METHFTQHVDHHTTTTPAQETETAQPARRQEEKSGIASFLARDRDRMEETVSRDRQEQAGARPLAAAAPREQARTSEGGSSWLNVQIKKNEEGRPLPRQGSSAAQTAKLDPTTPEFSTYMASMARNTQGKADYFRSEIDRMGPEPKRIIDFGTCGAELVERLTNDYPQHRFLGLDLSPKMLAVGKQRMNERGMERQPGLVAADGFRPPVADNSVDAVTMSSFFHELFSYSAQPHTNEGLKPAMEEVHRILKEDGRVIIRDPAKPENPDEPVYLKPFDHDGRNPATHEELMQAHPGELSTRALLSRFTEEFAPARKVFPDGKPRFDEQGRVQMPAWLASEFIRHRPFVMTPDDWASEMREQYGVFTPSELEAFAKECGFGHVEARTSYNPNNKASGYEEHMLVTDLEGKPYVQSERFPTQITAVLYKQTPEQMKEAVVKRWVADHATDAMPPSEGSDRFLGELLDRSGFAGLPEVVSKEQLDAHARAGEPILFRGVTSPEYAEQFRRGNLYPGTGSAGNGIYCASAERRDYAEEKATGTGEVMRMTLKAGAKIADEFDLDREMFQEREALKARTRQEIPSLRGPDREAKAAELARNAERLELLLYTDPGRYAAYKGYDAVALEGRGFLVLNRTALRVEEREG